MTSKIFDPQDRRALLLGMMCVLGLAVAFRGIPIWQAMRANARAVALETITSAEELELVLSSFDAAMDTLEARIAQLGAISPELLVGETPAGAGSNAEALLAEMARESLVRLDAIEIKVDTTKTQALPQVTIELQATADVTGLSAFLHRLERGPALLAVRRLAVRSAGVEDSPDQLETLAVQLTVEGVGLIRTAGNAQ